MFLVKDASSHLFDVSVVIKRWKAENMSARALFAISRSRIGFYHTATILSPDGRKTFLLPP